MLVVQFQVMLVHICIWCYRANIPLSPRYQGAYGVTSVDAEYGRRCSASCDGDWHVCRCASAEEADTHFSRRKYTLKILGSALMSVAVSTPCTPPPHIATTTAANQSLRIPIPPYRYGHIGTYEFEFELSNL